MEDLGKYRRMNFKMIIKNVLFTLSSLKYSSRFFQWDLFYHDHERQKRFLLRKMEENALCFTITMQCLSSFFERFLFSGSSCCLPGGGGDHGEEAAEAGLQGGGGGGQGRHDRQEG